MLETAYLKIQRASEHVQELTDLISEKRPFTYILETNTNTRERSTFAERKEQIIQQSALICGDCIHNLRSALDHAYYDVVSPFCNSPGDLKKIQFPFGDTLQRLIESIKSRLAERAGQWLVDAIIALKPYGEHGGNDLLYLVHELDIIDKHRLLIPAADYTQLSFDILRSQALDFPAFFRGTISFGSNRRDCVWPLNPAVLDGIRSLIPPNGVLEQELQIPVQIIFAGRPLGARREFIKTLNLMVDTTKMAVDAMRCP